MNKSSLTIKPCSNYIEFHIDITENSYFDLRIKKDNNYRIKKLKELTHSNKEYICLYSLVVCGKYENVTISNFGYSRSTNKFILKNGSILIEVDAINNHMNIINRWLDQLPPKQNLCCVLY